MDKQIAINNLKTVAKILTDMQVKWFVACGTALGLARGGTFIEHDKDIDVAVIGDDFNNEIRWSMQDAGFTFMYQFGDEGNGLELSFKKDDVKVDIFFIYHDSGKAWHSVWKRQKQLYYDFDAKLFENLRKVYFEGIEVFVPNPLSEYLTAQYGDWKKVKKVWDWSIDPLCLRT